MGLEITIVLLAAPATGSCDTPGLVVQLLTGRTPAGIPLFVLLTFLMFLTLPAASSTSS